MQRNVLTVSIDSGLHVAFDWSIYLCVFLFFVVVVVFWGGGKTKPGIEKIQEQT